MERSSPFVWVATALATLTSTAYAFGYLSFPPATYHDTTLSQIFTSEMNMSVHPMFYAMRQLAATRSTRTDIRPPKFIERLAFSDYVSLREFADDHFPGCGNSRMDTEPVNVYNASELLWRNEDEHFGFYPDNQGPCETWIDDQRVHFHANCVRTFPTYPARIPVDYSHCPQGRVCEVRFYWFAVDLDPFKLMKHCVRIVNDPYVPVAEENTDPHNKSSLADTFSVDLTMTWEKLWLTDDDVLGYTDAKDHGVGTTILIIP